MTTAQQPLTRVSPPPCDDAASIVIPSEHRERGIPPKPSPQYNLRGDNGFIDTNPLPDRCQFTFSDGRQCTMARSDIHPSLCRFHAEREDQLFGEPSPGGYVVGAALDLPELYSACRDLTTAAGVNRALAQVFRLLAQRRISRQEAATFGHLAQLLLRSISAMRQENLTSRLGSSGSAAKGYQQDALSPLNKVADPIRPSGESHQRVRFSDSGGVHRTPDTGVELSPVNKVVPSEHREPRRAVCVPDGFAGDLSFSSPRREASAARASCAEPDDVTGAVIATPLSADEPSDLSVPPAKKGRFSEPLAAGAAVKSVGNEHTCSAGLQLTQNEHLRKVVT